MKMDKESKADEGIEAVRRELRSMKRMAEILDSLDDAQQERVIAWLGKRLNGYRTEVAKY